MRGIPIIILIVTILSFVTNTNLLQAQAVIEGRVIDARTSEPLEGAHIFLADSQTGSVTNESGYYRLRRVSPGSYRLVASMIGYQRTPVEVVSRPGQREQIDFELDPVIYELGEVYVGNLDKRWEKHLERFTRLFIGETDRADSVKILNPEVLRFERRWWGRFTAEALAPLEIENRALGYRITYHMDEFHHSGSRTRWDGDPFYTEMEPADARQADYWEQNRREAFYGSLRHFLLSLLQDSTEEDGFVLYRSRQRDIHGYAPHRRSRVTARRLIRDGEEPYLYRLNFSGRLEIVYTGAGEDPRYIRWARDLNRGPAGSQTSYLELNERPVTVDTDGEIAEPYGATQFGYFAFERLADQTPREYRPGEYRVSNVE